MSFNASYGMRFPCSLEVWFPYKNLPFVLNGHAHLCSLPALISLLPMKIDDCKYFPLYHLYVERLNAQI